LRRKRETEGVACSYELELAAARWLEGLPFVREWLVAGFSESL
jgi:hypothetical protein